MSRSRKKHGVIKVGGGHETKTLASRKVRRRNRQQLIEGKDFFTSNELTNQWDICDYRLRYEKWGYMWMDLITRKRKYFNK